MECARWVRSAMLALTCAALYGVSVPYQAGFFGVSIEASLAHLHIGFMFAVAVLYRDRLPLLAVVLAALVVWLIAVGVRQHAPSIDLMGLGWSVVMYAALRSGARWLRSGKDPDWRFGVADMPRFVLFGMVALPLLLTLTNWVFSRWLDPHASMATMSSDAVQVLFAEFFGVLIVGLPMIVLGTRGRGRWPDVAWWREALPWRLLGVGVLLPMAALQLAARAGFDVDALLQVLLSNRLLVTAALIWATLRVGLRWSMPLLVLVEFFFATALARHAGASANLTDLAGLLRIAIDCMMLELLVLLLLLYSREREAALRRHERASLVEPLTGLSNVAALRRRCEVDGLPPLGFLLLDRVEKISTGLGLRAQAELPRWVATQLAGLADTYHIGTGQMVLVPSASQEDLAAQWEYVLQRLHESEFVWMDRRLRLLPYLGVAGAEMHEETLDARMLRASDAAIEARQRGEMRLQRAGMLAGVAPQVDRQRALQLSSTVLSRIRAGEIELHFQPFEPLSSRVAHESVSGEILCRLRDEQGELMLPGQFLGELQADRRMAELDLAVVRQLDRWLREHRPRLPLLGRLSINIGGQSLASRVFAQELLALLDRFALSPRQLCFEVTETAAITHAEESAALFTGLHERGCQISIDDFGVGFQSFERLKQIPVDVIKIDGSFVRDMTRSPRDLAMVRATVMVARAFKAETVAEYVEDAETAQALRELQVDWGQGYHFALPRPLDDVLLRR